MTGRTLLIVTGVRPQYLKAAALLPLLQRYAPEISSVVVDIRQHYDPRLNRDVIKDVDLKIDFAAKVKPAQSSLYYVARGLDVIQRAATDVGGPLAICVFGDANPALVGMVAAQKLNAPLVHVEAGARRDPAEQEHWNSVLVDRVSTLRFAVTARHLNELRNEGLGDGSFLSGDLAFDWYRSRGLDHGALASRSGVILTLHRPENMRPEVVEECLWGCVDAGEIPTLVTHPRNEPIVALAKLPPEAVILDALEPTRVLKLVAKSRAVLTDSGGLSREAHYLRTPVLMRRSRGGWPELRDFGVLAAVGTDRRAVKAGVEWAKSILTRYPDGSPLSNPDGVMCAIEQIRKVCCS